MLDLSLDLMLSHSCRNPIDDVWTEYRIEAHCVAFVIVARVAVPGVYDQELHDWKRVPHYEVRDYQMEPC